jgi:hypothetical protein
MSLATGTKLPDDLVAINVQYEPLHPASLCLLSGVSSRTINTGSHSYSCWAPLGLSGLVQLYQLGQLGGRR